MRCDMSDGQFLDWVDLKHPSMAAAGKLAVQGRTKPAALAAAEAMFSRPFVHPIRDGEIDELAAIIRRRFPDQVDYLTALADNYLLSPLGRPRRACGRNPEEEFSLYQLPARVWRARAESVHALSRLYRITGERRYRDAAIEHARAVFAARMVYPDGDDAGAFDWHPHCDISTHECGHASEKICHGLPYLRQSVTPQEALMLVKGLLAMAEFCFRTCRDEVPHNITLHMLTGAMLVGLCFPALKCSREWAELVHKRLEDDFASPPFATADGYFGEGLGYQSVNHSLIFTGLRYLTAAGRKVSPRFRQVCRRSFELAAACTRTDGKFPLFGDCHTQMPIEHYIHQHEILHAAAAWFRRADFKAAAGAPGNTDPMEYNVWLMGLAGFAWHDATAVPPPAQRELAGHDCRSSGFQFLGVGRGLAAHYGMFTCAAAHNHAHGDFGSIDLYGLGRPLLTDPSFAHYADRMHDATAHNTLVAVRRRPLGPRLDRKDFQKTLFVAHRPDIQVACMEHTLYESFVVRRTLCLVDADAAVGRAGRDGDRRAFWLVIDRVQRRLSRPRTWDDFLETFFHFNAPQSELGVDEAAMTCWSRHDGRVLELLRYPATDANFTEKPQVVPLADHLRANENVDSDANLQVTAVLPQRPRNVMDMRIIHGVTGEYGGRVKRPSMSYRWRGEMPYDAAYVLAPFRGLRKRAYAKVEGQWPRPGELEVTVALPGLAVTVRAKGLAGDGKDMSFSVKARR